MCVLGFLTFEFHLRNTKNNYLIIAYMRAIVFAFVFSLLVPRK